MGPATSAASPTISSAGTWSATQSPPTTGGTTPRSTWTTSTNWACGSSLSRTTRTPCRTRLPECWRPIARVSRNWTPRRSNSPPACMWRRWPGTARPAHICAGGELNTFAEQLAGASAVLAEGTLETFRRQLQRTGNNELTRAGASDQPAAQPQPVEGRVLSPPPPPVAAAIQNDPPATAPSSAAPKSPPSTDRASSETAKPEPDATWLAAWLVGILSVSAFVFGMLWRGAPNRRSRQSGAAGRRIGRR